MGIKSFIKRLPHEIWSKNEILLLKRSAGMPLDYSKRKEFKGEIIEATEANLEDCGAFEDPKRYVPIYRGMIQNGDLVHFGYLKGRCVFRHAAKCSGDIIFDGALVKTINKNKEIYIHYGYCAPKARGMGFHAESLFMFTNKFFDYDIYTLVKEENYSSLKGCFRVDYNPYMLIKLKHRFFSTKVEKIELNEEQKKRIIEACYN